MDNWTIVRTEDECKSMAGALLAGGGPTWAEGVSTLFGSECAWPLMIRVRDYVNEDSEPTPLTVEAGLADLRERLEFMISKADGERGISMPKAREQVNMLLWLFGREGQAISNSAGFAAVAQAGRALLADLPTSEGAGDE